VIAYALRRSVWAVVMLLAISLFLFFRLLSAP